MHVAEHEEKNIMYMPVADATVGMAPNWIKRGTKMRPAPIPTIPAKNPLKKASKINFIVKETSKNRSSFLKGYPAKAYSLCSP